MNIDYEFDEPLVNQKRRLFLVNRSEKRLSKKSHNFHHQRIAAPRKDLGYWKVKHVALGFILLPFLSAFSFSLVFFHSVSVCVLFCPFFFL